MRADLIRTILVSAILLILGAAAHVAAVQISASARLDLPGGSWPTAIGRLPWGPTVTLWDSDWSPSRPGWTAPTTGVVQS